MFSIFHGLFTLVAFGVDNYNKTTQDIDNKNRAIRDGRLTYNGSRGNEYLIENDRWVSTKRNSNGEDVIADMKTGRVYYNLTEMKKKRKEEECLAQGKTIRYKMENEKRDPYYGKYRQMYSEVDIKTRIPVGKIFINGVGFYISLKDGAVLRPEDNYKTDYLVGYWNVNELLSIINERQDQIRKDIDDMSSMKRDLNFFYKYCYVYIDKNKKVNIFSDTYGFKQRREYIKNDCNNEYLGKEI